MTGQGKIDAVAFAAANSGAYLSAVFAAYKAGQVVLALPRGSKMRSVQGVNILERQSFEDAPGWFEETFTPIRTNDPAQISFSSGTTGRPKAILLSHRAFADVIDRINAAMGVDATIREYIGVPVTFSFGFGRARAVATAGGKSYLPKNGFDPAEIARMLAADEINAISAVPTLWRVMLANKQVIEDVGHKVRWIEIGSQYMAASEKGALKTLFPNAKIVQHYGLTEASRSALLDISATEGAALESVGRVTGNVEIAIAEDGLIRIRGPHVAEGLVSGAGVKPVIDADGWLVTADKGRLENGFLYYEGRMDELINSGGIKIDPMQFEQRLLAAVGVGDGLAVGRVDDALRGDQVLIAVEQAAGLDMPIVEEAARKVAADFGLVGSGAMTLRLVSEIPKTPTGKVQRAKLAEMPDLNAASVVTAAGTDSNAAGNDTSEALRKLWSEVLNRDDVPLDQSFYDLGGDSLSALTTIMRMESLGLEPDIARGIFDGKTISEIAGVPATAVPAVEASNPIAEELRKLWSEVLNRDDVPLDQSFYDLGGDSLSALTTIMRMESLGLEPDIARGIFDGKTISEIAGAGGPPVAAAPPAPVPVAPAPVVRPKPEAVDTSRPGLTLAEAMNAVHATRGILILWVVVVHWLPGVLNRISASGPAIYDALLPILRFGTPGFAMVFGLGIGALGLTQYQSNRESFLKGVRFNTMLICGGVLVLAGFRLLVRLSGGELSGPFLLSIMFYSAISFYALAMLSMPLLMRLLTMGRNRLLTIFTVMIGCLIIHEVLRVTVAPLQLTGLAELVKILVSAKYGFFRMMYFVMVGVAIGYLFRQHYDRPGIGRELVQSGAVLIGSGFVMTYLVRPGDIFADFGLVEPWHLMIYAGSMLIILAGFSRINWQQEQGVPRWLHLFNAGAIASGILALPLFVGHELVLPAKQMLSTFGLPEALAIAIPLLIFFGGLAIAYRRLLRFLVRRTA